MPTTTTLTNQSGIDFGLDIDENVSTTLLAEKQFPFLMKDALRKLGQEIKEAVRDEYNQRRVGYSNSAVTSARKGVGKGALEETGRLKKAVTTWNEDEIQTNQIGDSYELKVTWSLPTAFGTGFSPLKRRDNTFVYLWSHEFGTERSITHKLFMSGNGFALIKTKENWALPERPFFVDGIQKGIEKGSQLAAAEMYMATDLTTISKRAPYVSTSLNIKMKKPVGMGGLLPQLYSTSLIGLIWYFVPPSQLYAVIGMSSDIAGFLRGSFFSMGMAGGYARQMAWAQTGFTKKILRRKFRGRLWGGD